MRKTPLAAAVLSVLIAAPPPTWASTTRLLSLGLDNWQLADEVNFWSNPARLKAAPNLGLFEMGTQSAGGGALTAGSQWGGFHKSIGSSVLALYVRRPYQTNDFTTAATPLVTPFPGGNILANGPIGVTGLDATTGNFGAGGPFNTDTGVLGITGAPSVARTLPLPQNYIDAIYAWSWGRMDWGVHVNYARNAGGEVRQVNYDSGSSAATPGTIRLERLSEETNVRAGWLWNGFEQSWLQMTMDFSLPNYSMEYDERRYSGQHSISRIDNEGSMGAGVSMQFARKNDESAWAATARAGYLDTSGIADRNDGGGAAAVSRVGYFANFRKFATFDYTWSYSFRDKALLLASAGFQRTSTKQTYVLSDNVTPANNDSDAAYVDQWQAPIRIAVEAQPWDLLILRGGIQKNVFSESQSRLIDKDGGGQPSLRETDTAITDPNGTANGVGLSFGAGIRLTENLLWDTVVRQTLLFNGPHFVGGVTSGGLFAQSTLVYRWGGVDSAYSNLKPLIPVKKLLSRLAKD